MFQWLRQKKLEPDSDKREVVPVWKAEVLKGTLLPTVFWRRKGIRREDRNAFLLPSFARKTVP